MSSTRKARGPVKEDGIDGHEERNIWIQIKGELERCIQIQKRQRVIGPQIKDLEEEYAKTPPSAHQIDELQSLYREMVKLTNEEQSLLKDEPSNILNNLEILIALRKASAADDGDFSRAASTSSKIRKPKTSTKMDAADSAAESPGPSPSLTKDKLKGNAGRSTSVASARDGKEIKIEEGAEGAKGPLAEKLGKLVVGAEVAYKQAKPKEDGSQWIICVVKSIQTVGGGKKKYEVQDPEPDDMGRPGDVFITSANALIAIPSQDEDLPDYPIGKAVLARYPETTTFYRAEVIANLRKGVCKLRFEDDQNQEMEVARRFVLRLEK